MRAINTLIPPGRQQRYGRTKSRETAVLPEPEPLNPTTPAESEPATLAEIET
ncbi:MAG: hypothetical protein M5U34_15245 [Chloroflexi bacterium]|nr:hypothetical protein [Chloroflexota bacterium]